MSPAVEHRSRASPTRPSASVTRSRRASAVAVGALEPHRHAGRRPARGRVEHVGRDRAHRAASACSSRSTVDLRQLAPDDLPQLGRRRVVAQPPVRARASISSAGLPAARMRNTRSNRSSYAALPVGERARAGRVRAARRQPARAPENSASWPAPARSPIRGWRARAASTSSGVRPARWSRARTTNADPSAYGRPASIVVDPSRDVEARSGVGAVPRPSGSALNQSMLLSA